MLSPPKTGLTRGAPRTQEEPGNRDLEALGNRGQQELDRGFERLGNQA